MKTVQFTDSPIRIYGLNTIDARERNFWRLDEQILQKMPQYSELGKRSIGGRVRFITNSANITFRMELKTLEVDRCICLPGSAGADVYYGAGEESRYAGYIAPVDYEASGRFVERKLTKPAQVELVTINLPRNDNLASLEISIDEDAELLAPTDYRVEKPIIYYGSSITEGGCAPRPGTAYTSILSRWLDADYFNYGFSGAAKGEPEFAEFIAGHQNISLFIYDYDHNAPNPEHLLKTHEPFFKIIRGVHPELPIIMMSRPDFDGNVKESLLRREAIYRTFMNARSDGDNNVYFIDGEQFFGHTGREECTIDGCHPNALGFMRMAQTIYPLAKSLLR
jgi:hypothetical protein